MQKKILANELENILKNKMLEKNISTSTHEVNETIKTLLVEQILMNVSFAMNYSISKKTNNNLFKNFQNCLNYSNELEQEEESKYQKFLLEKSFNNKSNNIIN